MSYVMEKLNSVWETLKALSDKTAELLTEVAVFLYECTMVVVEPLALVALDIIVVLLVLALILAVVIFLIGFVVVVSLASGLAQVVRKAKELTWVGIEAAKKSVQTLREIHEEINEARRAHGEKDVSWEDIYADSPVTPEPSPV